MISTKVFTGWQNCYQVQSIAAEFFFLVGGYYDKGAYIQDVLIVDSEKGRIRLVSAIGSEGYIGGLFAVKDRTIFLAHADTDFGNHFVHRIDMDTLEVTRESTPFPDFLNDKIAEEMLYTLFEELVGPETKIEKLVHVTY